MSGKNPFLSFGFVSPFMTFMRASISKNLLLGTSLDLNFTENLSLIDDISGTNLITFSRASIGTYVGSDGLIKTSPVNLLTYSDYSQVAPTTDAQLEGVVAAPDGTITARRYSVPSAGLDTINKVYTLGTAGKDYTFSVWIRSTGTASEVRIIVGDSAVNAIVQISAQWQRFEITKINNASNLVRGYVIILNVGDEVEVFGAQIEEGTTATDYIPTTTTASGAPRFDHDPVTGESLGLLIEESRTNYMLNSGTTAEMVASSGVVRTSGGFAAPDGSTEASRVDLPAVTGPNQVEIITEQFTGLQTSTDYTASIYLKGINGGELVYLTFAPGVATSFVAANLTTEWQRFDITRTTNTGTLFFNVGVDTRSGTGQANQPAQSFYAWGAQVEKGSFPTSYIPTTSSTVTRAADVASIEGTNFSSWYNQSEGTVFVDRTFNINNGQTYYFTDSVLVLNRVRLEGINHYGNNSSDGSSFNAAAAGNKTALGLQTDNVSVNGGTPDASFTMPSSLDRLFIGRHPTVSSYLNGHIARLAYFPTRKTDQELIDLTT